MQSSAVNTFENGWVGWSVPTVTVYLHWVSLPHTALLKQSFGLLKYPLLHMQLDPGSQAELDGHLHWPAEDAPGIEKVEFGQGSV